MHPESPGSPVVELMVSGRLYGKSYSQEILKMALAAQVANGAITCSFKHQDGRICGRDPVKYFKHLKMGVYVGFCKEHKSQYPENWSAFKPVSKDEVVTHEVMDS
jgi:hypothetical protein